MKVSVAMVTYNHEKFIAKTLDSVLMQQTAFEYEIVIGEDCSTDTTRDIVSEYKRNYPDKIRLFLNEKNMGMHANGAQVLQACTGEYIAMLDGDDYWTSADKLQQQVDFLDRHHGCSACFHDALIVAEDGSEEPRRYREKQKEFSTVDDVLVDNFIPTAAVMFRRRLTEELPAWADSLKMGDWVLHILNALHGPIGYIDKTMSVYVVHRGGVWSMKSRQDHAVAMIELFEALDRHLPRRYRYSTARILRWRYADASTVYEQSGGLKSAGSYAVKAFVQHVKIVCGRLFSWKSREPSPLPHEIASVSGDRLFKNLLRLNVLPVMRSLFPLPLYKWLGALARKFDMEL
ncbi:MAG: glycosyltransferase [Desulfuromonadaceae bacterium]|nr:glycosyltransferase [Desulfuromonadaceae bacterium]MDD2848958.1 glycosyltransferase [Desulfuromonadaceae bacterium]MDD4130307.1 glycosyltransferase [Desulfuromonadaceae bacterium]